MICKKCGKQNEDNAKFCLNCGNNLENQSQVIFCTDCFEVVDENGKFCDKCGALINPEFTQDKMLIKQAGIRNESIYQNAVITGEPGSVLTNKYESAIKLLEAIPGYKDADTLIEQYTEIVKERKEKAGLERQVKQKKAKMIKQIGIVLGIIIVLILGAVFLTNKDDARESAEINPITVVVYEKNDYPEYNMNGRYVPFCEINLRVTNNTEKTIQGIQGKLYVLDSNETFFAVDWTITGQNIQPGATVDITGYGVEVDESIDEHQKLFYTAYEDLKFSFQESQIIYAGETAPTD